MKLHKILGLCIMTACALSAIVVASASASPPEIGRCVKVAATGKFTSATCIKEEKGKKIGKGNYEWEAGPGAKNKFKTSAGSGVLETENGTAVGCKTEESGGEVNGTKTFTGVTVRFTGCQTLGTPCKTTGAAEGEIVTNPLEGKIGIEKKPKKVAVDLFPTPADDGLYATFTCLRTLKASVGGSVLVPITSDKMASTFALKYSTKKGIQKPSKLEGESEDVLLTEINEDGRDERSGITITSTQVMEEEMEINTVF